MDEKFFTASTIIEENIQEVRHILKGDVEYTNYNSIPELFL